MHPFGCIFVLKRKRRDDVRLHRESITSVQGGDDNGIWRQRTVASIDSDGG